MAEPTVVDLRNVLLFIEVISVTLVSTYE